MNAEINGINVFYETHGTGRTVLFLHGFPLSHRLWTPLVQPLAGAGRLVLPDLRGHGRTEATASTTMAEFADDLAGLLDHLGETEPVVVVGLSMGGYIAFEFFRRHRRRIGALVLADTRPNADTAEAAQGRLKTADEVLEKGSRVVADAMIAKLFAPHAPATLRDEWYAIMAGTSPVGVAAALRAMAARADSTETLAAIDVPTLIVVGEQDAITPPGDARSMHAAVKGSHLEIIPGAGHMPPVETPHPFAAALRRFLDSVA